MATLRMTTNGVSDPPQQTGCDVLLVEDLDQQRLPARALAAVLRQAGYRVHLAHYGPGRPDGGRNATGAVVALAGRLQPRLVLLSILFASRVPEHLALADALRSAGVHAHITIAGPLPSFAPAELMAACPALDSVLCGEAEASIVALAAGLDEPAQRPALPGLAYRTPHGSIRPAEEWPAPVADLDTLPFPAYDGGLPTYRGCGFATVEGSRGCYHSCAFCLPSAFYKAAAARNQKAGGSGRSRYRSRSVGNLVDEVEALYRRGARLFLFDDEQFLAPAPRRAARVAQFEAELERRGLEIAFTIKCRADDVETALFRRLRHMGLLRVYVGVESGCQESLDLFGKGVKAERNLEALAALDDLGIVADFYDLAFHPWSTLGAVEAEIAFCRSAASHISTPLRFNEVGIFPGTRLAQRLRAEGRCSGEPWSWTYRAADPRVEVLRRLNCLIFGASGPRTNIDRMLTESWFALLLEQRFQPAPVDEALTRRLREVAAGLNLEGLAVWSEMLEFARAGPILEAGPVNDAAGCWAARVNAGCMRAAGTLAELGLPDPAGAGTEVTPLC
jgi:anaerobic magnesium-protoporphyrin IX monomethyl ester cyclase